MVAPVAEGTQTTSAGIVFDAIIGRLSYDEEFANALTANPGDMLDLAGLHLDKESVELFIKSDPKRFDLICDRLAELVHPDVIVAVSAPTCG
ncbi:hypothetical protein [Actinacidiphila sp. bgisy145]|uniref:hypothetical protein n=1 Tax=Actinacidiphila sp. bgisy145 TaxID=3413792 RepID=UPI003EBC57D2